MEFASAIKNQSTVTENGMPARVSTANACTDLFFKIGASRGKNVLPDFVAAYVENSDYALRILQWARDIRGGAGERQIFRDLLLALANDYPVTALRILEKVPEIGRWDDLLLDFKNVEVKEYACGIIAEALKNGNALCAKWMPRRGLKAVYLRNYLELSPKQYRKLLVGLTNVVETKMCNKKWDDINYSQVPSLAHSRYRSAFYKNSEERYKAYVEELKSGKTPKVKINAGAVYPYDVVKSLFINWRYEDTTTNTEKDLIIEQWKALENFVGDANVLPMIDVSGSMYCNVGGNLTAIQVAISLGLYVADKNEGKFKDCFLTFSEYPQLQQAKGNIVQKIIQLKKADWGMNTNLEIAFEKVLQTGIENNVPVEEMPDHIVIFSDMQFDSCAKFNDSAMEMIRRKYSEAEYNMPQIIFWNLVSYDNVPVKFDENGVALVSGFSPSIMKAVLAADFDNFTPKAIMLQTIMNERYDY